MVRSLIMSMKPILFKQVIAITVRIHLKKETAGLLRGVQGTQRHGVNNGVPSADKHVTIIDR